MHSSTSAVLASQFCRSCLRSYAENRVCTQHGILLRRLNRCVFTTHFFTFLDRFVLRRYIFLKTGLILGIYYLSPFSSQLPLLSSGAMYHRFVILNWLFSSMHGHSCHWYYSVVRYSARAQRVPWDVAALQAAQRITIQESNSIWDRFNVLKLSVPPTLYSSVVDTSIQRILLRLEAFLPKRNVC